MTAAAPGAVSGLRRFAGPTGTSGAAPADTATPPEPRVERCEMCATPLDDRHGHVVDLEHRTLVCTCRACSLLFTSPGAGQGRYRAVPDDVRSDPEHPLDTVDWEALQIPVGTVFFFTNSDLGRVVGCYPSPGGATECELDLSEWDRLQARYPLLAALQPDVQAVLVHRTGDRLETFLVPIDACYALVGRVRREWRGLDGGDEVRAVVAECVADLRARSRALT